MSRSLRFIALGGINISTTTSKAAAFHIPKYVLVSTTRSPCCAASFLRSRPLSSSSSACSSQNNPPEETLDDNTEEKPQYRFHPDTKQKTFLVVGDGDLSYSASIASSLAEAGTTLVASVLEQQDAHERVYRNSQHHRDTILKTLDNHSVLFETDATQLHHQFPPHCLDVIQFNFPHWRGKSNNKYNRQLLGDFLASAKQVLKQPQHNNNNSTDGGGEIQVALRREQGGARAQDLTEWRLSWQAAELAANTGLLLSRVDPFEADYDVSSYRGADRGFQVGENPERYIFTFPPNSSSDTGNNSGEGGGVDRELQLCYRHELRLYLEPDKVAASVHSEEALLDDDIVFDIAREIAPEGVHVEIPMKTRIDPTPGKHTHVPLLVFLMVYSGENIPLPRPEADEIRQRLEQTITARLGFEIAKSGRLVSKAFPYPVLERLIWDYSA